MFKGFKVVGVSCGVVCGDNSKVVWCVGVCGYPQGYWWLVDSLRVVDNFVDRVVDGWGNEKTLAWALPN